MHSNYIVDDIRVWSHLTENYECNIYIQLLDKLQ